MITIIKLDHTNIRVDKSHCTNFVAPIAWVYFAGARTQLCVQAGHNIAKNQVMGLATASLCA